MKLSLKDRYRDMSSEHLAVLVIIYSKPGMRTVFAKQLKAMATELLERALPDYAEDVGGYLVACPVGVQ